MRKSLYVIASALSFALRALGSAVLSLGRMCRSFTVSFVEPCTKALNKTGTKIGALFRQLFSAKPVAAEIGGRTCLNSTVTSTRNRSAGLSLGFFLHRTSLCM